MKTLKTDNFLIIYLNGRMDAANSTEIGAELNSLASASACDDVILDLSELRYISSAGLRALLKLRQTGRNISVRGLNGEVRSVFKMTGFDEIFGIDCCETEKPMREAVVDDKMLIGQGSYGKVYLLDDETVIKVYNERFTPSFIENEREVSKKAFVMGVPTAISYETVRVGSCYGVVYEMIGASTVSERINSDPSSIEFLAEHTAKLVKSIHSKTVTDKILFPSRREQIISLTEDISGFLGEEDAAHLRRFAESIPDSDHFSHGSCDPSNIMVCGSNLITIDVGNAGCGDSIFDIAAMYNYCCYTANSPVIPFERKRRLIGFDIEFAPEFWREFCESYFGISPAEVRDIEAKVKPYAALLRFMNKIQLECTSEEQKKEVTQKTLAGKTAIIFRT